MKKIFALLVAVTIVASMCLFPVSAAAAEPVPAEETITQEVEEASVSPRIMHHYTKTVKKTYESHASAPESIYYEEYNMDAWFRGTLYLKSIVLQSNGVWLATYTGTLQGQI